MKRNLAEVLFAKHQKLKGFGMKERRELLGRASLTATRCHGQLALFVTVTFQNIELFKVQPSHATDGIEAWSMCVHHTDTGGRRSENEWLDMTLKVASIWELGFTPMRLVASAAVSRIFGKALCRYPR